MPASSVVAIGDELVGGFTLDSNSHWLAERLRLLGFPVKRMTALRDRPREIVDQLQRELDDPEVTHVFWSGGLGPTPDHRHFPLAVEARFSPLMKELEEKFPDVSVGSYPNYETKELVIRVLGSDPKRVDEVLGVVRRQSAELGMTGDSR